MTATDGTPLPEPGWYPDQVDPFLLRYWDGATWTDHTTSRAQAEAVLAAPIAPAPSFGGPAQEGHAAAFGLDPAAPPAPGSPLSFIALLLAVLALVTGGILFGGVGIVLAVIGRRRGEPLARVAVPAAVAGTVLGLLILGLVISLTG